MPFKVGDKVRVINYGSKAWAHGEMVKYMREKYDPNWPKNAIQVFKDGHVCFDQDPDRIGTEDVIEEVCDVQGRTQYSLSRSAWYYDDQLELINE
jgi:hypothetical protein